MNRSLRVFALVNRHFLRPPIMSDDKKKEKSPFAGALADKLKDLDIEPSGDDSRSRDSKDASSQDKASQSKHDQSQQGPSKQAQSRQNAERPEPAEPDEDEELSDEELFKKALEDLSREDVYRGKFEGEGPKVAGGSKSGTASRERPIGATEDDSPSADERQPVDEEQARQEVEELRDWRAFERAVGPIDKTVDRGKYRKPELPDPAEHAAKVGAYRSDSPEDLTTPALPKSGDGLNHVGPLEASQKQLLDRYKKRSRRVEVAELNVRGDTVEDALRQLELFVHQEWKKSARFVRIIHGRGLRSDGPPVLKPAVLRWLEGPGFRYVRGYAPEVNSARDYGSIVVELDPQNKDTE